MSILETRKTCCICKKRFCCVDCRKRHEDNKHPNRELDCPLCLSQKLPLQIFESEEFFCHVVINHLPLYCCLCGTVFSKSKDLEDFGACKWWQTRLNRHSVVSGLKSSPGTPSSEVLPLIKSNDTSSFDGHFVSLTSPPELFRKTSTPMHVAFPGQKTDFEFKTPSVPNFSLKTPKTGSAASTKSRQSRTDLSSVSKDSAGETKFVSFSPHELNHSEKTPFRSNAMTRYGLSDHISRSNSGRKLDVMEEQDEGGSGETGTNSYRSKTVPKDVEILSVRTRIDLEDMDLTGVVDNGIGSDMELANSRTRLSSDDMELTDVHGKINALADTSSMKLQPRIESNLKLNTTRKDSPDTGPSHVETTRSPETMGLEILSQKPEKRMESTKRVRFSDQYEPQPEHRSASGFNVTENDEYFEAHDTTSALKNSSVQRQQDSSMDSSPDNSDIKIYRDNKKNMEKENENPTRTVKSGSSRVVMMVVVENNDGLTTTDLTPLIDSSLKKLEERTSTIYSSMSSHTNQDTSGGSRRSITSVDSYVSVSSIENMSTVNSSTSLRQQESKLPTGSGGNSGGIFSAVAHALKYALKNFSGVGSSRTLTDTAMSSRENTSNPSTSATSIECSSSSLTSSLLDRRSKRPRDTSESSLSSSGSFGSSTSLDALLQSNDVCSPVAKRHRGWYKIKGREPIARMRNGGVISPRGISSETQVFSQGSLSVGDTILPIPSRAHQSTQTE